MQQDAGREPVSAAAGWQMAFQRSVACIRTARNLVVVRAGRRSLHQHWIEGPGEAAFDLLVVPYERDAPPGPTPQSTILIPGRKIEGYRELFKRRPDILDCYDYIALFDDDLLIDKRDLSSLFAIGASYKLDIFQPTLSWDSHFSYAATLSNPAFRLRYVNAVEMMCPVFSREHLIRALPLFDLGYELGIDLVWTRMTAEPWFRSAMIDAVAVKHTRPVGVTKVQHLPSDGGGYDDEIPQLLLRFQTEFRGFVAYAAIDVHGEAVLSRSAIGLRATNLWRAWPQTPEPKRRFARYVSDHLRHSFLRPINLDPISLSSCGRPPLAVEQLS